MAWPKGKPRPVGAGRAKGTPNVRTRAIRELLEAKNIDIAAIMLEDLMMIDEPIQRFNACAQLLPYIYPKLTAVAVSGDLTINPYADKSEEELEVLVKERLKKNLKQSCE